jgi:hypothetical protein
MTYGSPYENIWVDYSPHTEGWGDVSVFESYGYTKYIRKDIMQARIDKLEAFIDKAFEAHSNLDLDIDSYHEENN